MAGRVPWPAASLACSEPGGPPIRIARTGILIPIARNRSRFFDIAFVSGRTPSNITIQKTAPYGWIDEYLRRICNGDCRPGALPLLGLGLPGLLDRLQRREILHQKPVGEDVTTADLAQKDAFGCIIQKPNVVPRRIVIAP